MAKFEPREFELERGGVALRGETLGEGPEIVLLHGLTASRRYVVHRSRALPRAGHRLIAFDARGHGESGGAPEDVPYTYDELVADLEAVVDDQAQGRPLLAGHSMGAHTAAAAALADPDRYAGLVLVGPAVDGGPPGGESIEYWDRLASSLEEDGIDGFVAALGPHDPAWVETIERITRERMSAHRDLGAIVRCLREIPRSQPFEGMDDLAELDLPVLLVASRDEADPGHPYAVAERWAARISGAELISEDEGESPLAWQGGKLSREIAAFVASDGVRRRVG
ncbi:alpha/beta hydrolase [Thermoleophilia bacterium SCSIO 60948]|nr:alpha/beta hydrolase [Thermoleophilia bacterium SCSIO 60948]